MLRGRVVAAIGVFDGVHRAHQELLRAVVARGKEVGCASLCVTFHPHPDEVLFPDRGTLYLSSHAEKLGYIMETGIDKVLDLPFTRELSQMTADAFIENLVRDRPLAELWMGPDSAVGKDRRGDVTYLGALGRRLGFAVQVLAPVQNGPDLVSSSNIRRLLESGNVTRANQLLGRRYRLTSQVVAGAGRGRTLGFPTANLQYPTKRVIPAEGVYSTVAVVEGRSYAAVVNVGGRPTFGDGSPLIEVHLVGAEAELQRETLEVHFVSRLRQVERFASAEQLQAQIEKDVETVKGLCIVP